MIERDHLVLVKHAPLVEDLKQYGSQAVQGYYRDPNTPFNIPQSFPPTPPKGQVCDIWHQQWLISKSFFQHSHIGSSHQRPLCAF